MSRKERRLRIFGALYLIAAVLVLGRVVVLCYPQTVQAFERWFSGRTAEVFSALTDALTEGGGVREVFGALLP